MTDTATKEERKAGKKAKQRDQILLSDSDSSQPDLECDTCGVSFTDTKSYKSHLQGKKHQKKVSEAKFFAKNSAAVGEEDDSDEDDEDLKEIHCEVCDKNITGYLPYAAHLKGSVHKKNLKKQKLKEKLKDLPEVLHKEGEETGSDDDECLAMPYARCATCQKSFSGPEPLNLHMKSAAHNKKVKQTQTLQNLKAKYDDGTKNSDDDEFYSKCDVCQKSFSGHIPFQIHMASGAHKKSLEKKKVAEEMKQFCLNEDTTEGYVCKECKKMFTDPLAFKSHLENNSHEKQKAKDALKEFLTSHPEIVFATPVDNDSEGSDTEESDSQYYLICKLCHMSFSGPESAQDHVKSKKHISAKKEKKLLKLLKEQNVRSPVESSDKDGATKGPKPSPNGNSVISKEKTTEKPQNLDDFEML